jgi:hypothetical protein
LLAKTGKDFGTPDLAEAPPEKVSLHDGFSEARDDGAEPGNSTRRR